MSIDQSAEALLQGLKEAMDAVAALPPFPVKIEAPSTIIRELEEKLPRANRRPIHLGPRALMAYRAGELPIVRDDEIPMRTIRVHYSDGTIRDERL